MINGERIQNAADLYLGEPQDFLSNPKIFEQIEKHQVLSDICGKFDNPPILFLYTHRLQQFADKLHYFQNPFTLITHNSDVNLVDTNPLVIQILASPLLLRWWGQNLCFVHPKMHFLPIGLANTQWEHGDLRNFADLPFRKTSDDIYLNFQVYTNVEKRRPCVDALVSRGIKWLPMVTGREHVQRLSNYRWCACPEGHGVDTHRLWECFYVKCVPIVLKSPFIETLMHYTNNELPIHVIDSWWDFELPVYDETKFINNKWLYLQDLFPLLKNS
jgi:hypothetical protein